MAILDPANATGAEAAHHAAAYSGGAPVSAADCGASTASTSSSSFDELLMGLGRSLQTASRSSLVSAATDTQDSNHDESATNEDNKPRPGAVQNPAPCGHNTWDNVRIKKGNHSLRCRLCQKQWKVHHSFFTRCNLFLKGRCDLGASCSQVHVYQYKEGLKERRGRFGDGVLEGVPVKILEGHGMLSKRKMARVESCSDEDDSAKARKLHPTISQGSSSSQNTPPPKSPAESGAGFSPSAAQLKMPNGMAPGMMLPGMAQQMSHLNAMTSPLAAAHAAAAASALRQPMPMPMMGGAGLGNPAQLQNAAAMSALTGVDLTTVLAVQQMNQMKQLSDVMAVMQLSASNANAANLAASMGLGQLGTMHGIGLPGSVGAGLPTPFTAQANAAGTPPFGNAAAASDPAALFMQQAAQNLQTGR